MLPQNEQVLRKRWPALAQALMGTQLPRVQVLHGEHQQILRVSGIQLESAYDAHGEAELQGLLIPLDAPQAVVYGVAQGCLIRNLLKRPMLKRLRIMVLAQSASRASLSFFDHSDWLDDPRVELCLPHEGQELESPLAVAAACLSLADGHGARLRDLLAMQLARPHVQSGMQDFREDRERNLRDNRELVLSDQSVAALVGSMPGATLSIAAAGPTLSDHFDELRASKAPLIALDAALKPLLQAGIVPDYVVTQDCVEFTMRAFFDVGPSKLDACKLIYFSSSAHAVVAGWEGPRYSAQEGAAGELGKLWSSGSVIHPAVDLALQIGAKCVRLFGADFATPRGRSHVGGSSFEIPAPLDPLKPKLIDGHGDPVQSLPNLIGYLRDLERFIAVHPGVRFENAGREGALILGTHFTEASHAA